MPRKVLWPGHRDKHVRANTSIHISMELCDSHCRLPQSPAGICVPYISWKGRIGLESAPKRVGGREKDRHLMQRRLSNDVRLLQIPPCQHSAPRIGHFDAHRTHVSCTHRSIESHPVDTTRCGCRGSSCTRSLATDLK